MNGNTTATVLVVTTLVLASISGVGLVSAEDFPSATDGKIANGEELKTETDNDDQRYQINYTFDLKNHQPGVEDVGVNHYAAGLTENGTLHRIKLVSQDFGFSNCEPDNSAAFGIDRGNDDPGTNTDRSLLTAFRSYESTENYIDIKFYKEDTLAGEQISGDVTDQIVAAQNNCYDTPSEPGWYRINGTVTGHNAGTSGTDTNYKIRDLSQWVYVCDCSSRAEAEETLGPPPSEDGDDTGGSSTGDGSSTATPTPTVTATPDASSDDDTTESTATPTPTPIAADAASTPTATPTATATATATPERSGGSGQSTPTATAASGGSGSAGDGGAGVSTDTATATAATGNQGGASVQGSEVMTPTAGSGPGFGGIVALGGLLGAALLALRRG